MQKHIDDKTSAIYCESIGNPAGNIVDIEALADMGHEHGVPLIVDNTGGKLVEVDRKGKVVWRCTVDQPRAAERLPNGNTLVTSKAKKVLEVDPAGRTVWKLEKGFQNAFDVDRLPNGNTLVADFAGFVLEFDRAGKLVGLVR